MRQMIRRKRPPRLREKLRAQTHEAILEAVEQLALEQGVGGIQIAAVAERAGVAVGTLYNYYDNSEAMLAALFRARRAQLVPMIEATSRATHRLAFEPRLRAFVHEMLIIFNAYERFVRISVLVDRLGSRCKPRDTTVRDEFVAALEVIMADGARAKRFPAARVPVYARIVHGAIRAMFLWRLSEQEPITADGDVIVETLLHGMLPAAAPAPAAAQRDADVRRAAAGSDRGAPPRRRTRSASTRSL
jgi:AcrR family transcriptional regulator